MERDQVYTRVDPTTKEELGKIAKRKRLTQSMIFRIALEEYVERNRVHVTIAGPEYIDGGKR